MPNDLDVHLPEGRVLRVHDTGPGSGGPALVWHHGTPQTGELLGPVVAPAASRGFRVISYGRPSYGGSSPLPGRTVASAAADVEAIVDMLGVERVTVMGASGGGPHALACAALLPGRVVAAITIASPAPYTQDFDWFAGMRSPGALQAARRGRAARARFAETDTFDPSQFVAADWEALREEWAPLGTDAGRADAEGPDGAIDDDVAFATPWGFDPGSIRVPVLLIHGGADRVVPVSHSRWLVDHLPEAELWLRPRDGHVSVLRAVPVALDWLRAHAASADGVNVSSTHAESREV